MKAASAVADELCIADVLQVCTAAFKLYIVHVLRRTVAVALNTADRFQVQ